MLEEILKSILLIFLGGLAKHLFDKIVIESNKEINSLRGEISMNLTLYSNIYSNFDQNYIQSYFKKKKENTLTPEDIETLKEIQKIGFEFRKLASRLIAAANTLRWWQFSPIKNEELAKAATCMIGLSNFTSTTDLLNNLQQAKDIKKWLKLKY